MDHFSLSGLAETGLLSAKGVKLEISNKAINPRNIVTALFLTTMSIVSYCPPLVNTSTVPFWSLGLKRKEDGESKWCLNIADVGYSSKVIREKL